MIENFCGECGLYEREKWNEKLCDVLVLEEERQNVSFCGEYEPVIWNVKTCDGYELVILNGRTWGECELEI